ncbi:MAG: hypothetical protein JXR37_06980 [Kiritimatiellae bacterium]|nr:hypothetical protein [Kiritimatiellia bacterium]
MKTSALRTVAATLAALLCLLPLGCEDEEDEVEISMVRGQSAYVDVQVWICGGNDKLYSCYAEIEEADLANLDVLIASAGIVDYRHCRAQLRIHVLEDAAPGTYDVVVRFHATYEDAAFGSWADAEEDAVVRVTVPAPAE